MAEGKKTFIFYSDWINMVREMPNESAGELLKHILSYVNDENPTTDNLLVKMAFGHMKPMLKSDLDKWEGIREIRKKAGAKGGKANAKQNKANAKQVEAVNVNVNVNDNVNDNNNVVDNEKLKKDVFYTIDKLQEFYLNDEKVINAVISNPKNRMLNTSYLKERLDEFSISLIQNGEQSKTFSDFCKHFRLWHLKTIDIKDTTVKKEILPPTHRSNFVL